MTGCTQMLSRHMSKNPESMSRTWWDSRLITMHDMEGRLYTCPAPRHPARLSALGCSKVDGNACIGNGWMACMIAGVGAWAAGILA